MTDERIATELKAYQFVWMADAIRKRLAEIERLKGEKRPANG